MPQAPPIRSRYPAAALALLIASCAYNPENPGGRGLESVHQPVVERSLLTLDLAAGYGGLDFGEQRRLDNWFTGLDLRSGDRVAIDDPSGNVAAQDTIAALAARYGVLIARGPAPVTEGGVAPGSVRVVVSRSVASVPGCPDWSDKTDLNLTNATNSNYGCATNANLAAMVADPEHLLHGARDRGATTLLTATKAIESYRKAPPTGESGLKEVSSAEGGGAQ
ncbi:MAG: CpaD family pilus assembly lipoprotein [Novosphingobium sp.]